MIDDALRKAAYEKGIEVRLLGSHWEHSPCDMRSFLESLGSWNITGPKKGSIKTVSTTYTLDMYTYKSRPLRTLDMYTYKTSAVTAPQNCS